MNIVCYWPVFTLHLFYPETEHKLHRVFWCHEFAISRECFLCLRAEVPALVFVFQFFTAVAINWPFGLLRTRGGHSSSLVRRQQYVARAHTTQDGQLPPNSHNIYLERPCSHSNQWSPQKQLQTLRPRLAAEAQARESRSRGDLEATVESQVRNLSISNRADMRGRRGAGGCRVRTGGTAGARLRRDAASGANCAPPWGPTPGSAGRLSLRGFRHLNREFWRLLM